MEETPQCSWIGSDFIKANLGKEICLSELFSLDSDKFLGEGISEQFPYVKEGLPFLFKVLSVNKALSIQAHPNRAKAELLNAERPEIYKDPNPKPEIAIGLSDDFKACCGFADEEIIVRNFTQNPPLAELLVKLLGEKSDYFSPMDQFLNDFTSALFNELDKQPDEIHKVVSQMETHIGTLKQEDRTEHHELCLQLIPQYGTKDIGIIFVFLLNYVHVKKGEWFLITPDVPHAYIQGELMECMINSDNVVRGGLTPKLKDTQTLCEILPYDSYGPP